MNDAEDLPALEVTPPPEPEVQPDPAVNFVKYDPATGRIQWLGTVPRSMLELQGEGVIEGTASLLTDYVKDGVVTARPENPATLSGMTLLTLPNPCVITVQGVAHDCTDDTADLSFSQPGTYEVRVSAFPMLDATFQVTQP
jgi:hypothetical protein